MTNSPPSSLPKILLGLLLGMCVVAGIVVMQDQPEGNRGKPHSVHPTTMLEGGSGVERLGNVRWLGLAFALCQVGIYVGTMVLGMRRSKGRMTLLVIVGLLYAASFVALAVVDLAYARGDVRTIVGGLPLPTAIMIYAVGGIPVLFIAFYTLYFDSWVLTPDEQARIEKLAAHYQEQQEAPA